MNCKPGDLAVIVRDEVVRDLHKLVYVREAYGFDKDGDFCWICDSAGSALVYYDVANKRRYGKKEIVIPDAWLRPIRDPGDDAVDESLAWLSPVPSTQKEFV